MRKRLLTEVLLKKVPGTFFANGNAKKGGQGRGESRRVELVLSVEKGQKTQTEIYTGTHTYTNGAFPPAGAGWLVMQRCGAVCVSTAGGWGSN